MPREKTKKIALSLAVPMLLAHVAHANDVELEAVKVVSAAGYEQKITDAPASISVITKEELQKRSYTNLLDAVRETEGVDIGETRDKTGQGSVSIRGMGGDYTLLLIDGKRQNNVGDIYPNNFGGNQQNHIPPLEMIERIEVIRGPMATLYGADAIGGVVHIITKKISNEWVASATVSQTIQTNDAFGDDRTLDIAVMGPIVKDTLGLGLRASKYNKDASNPEYASTIDPDGNVVERELGFGGGGRTVANENYNLGARLSYKPHEKHEFVFDIETSRQRYDNAEGQVGTIDSIDSIWRASGGKVQPRVGYAKEQKFERDQWSLSYEGDWDAAKTKLSAYEVTTANFGRSLPFSVDERIDLQALWDAACVAGVGAAGCSNADMSNLTPAQLARLNAFLPRPERIMETRQLTVDGKVDIPLEEHLVILGFQYIDAEMEDGVFGMTDTSGVQAGKVQPHKQWALFAEENWYMFEGFTLTAGARYDKHEVFGSNTSPRIYGVYSFLGDWTIKGGVGTGYKTPKTSDLFDGITGFGGQGTSPFVGNPDLKPEKSVNKEIALYYENTRKDTFNVTYFHNDFKDKIQSGETVGVDLGAGWTSLGYTTYRKKINIDEAVIKGVEVAAKVHIIPEIALRGNYTYTDSEQKSGASMGQPLTNTAKHMYNVAIDYMPTDKLATYLIFTGEKDRFRDWDATTNSALYYKDYNVLNAGVRYKANENVTLVGRVNNLLDRDFTTYTTTFSGTPGNWEATYTDDYNTKAKLREFWLSMNVKI
ncbi:MAG: TonB-dependent receptor [Thiovulaceae bacterium]|nr:TonB-dependent receptor [Sulfurimonadaceae bacterium]